MVGQDLGPVFRFTNSPRNHIWDEKYGAKDGDEYQRFEELPEPIDGHHVSGFLGSIQDQLTSGMSKLMGTEEAGEEAPLGADPSIQLCQRFVMTDEGEQTFVSDRFSCTKWSAGHDTEHSIANAYIEIISKAKHFVYIENQVIPTHH